MPRLVQPRRTSQVSHRSFFSDTPTTDTYTLSLHDALPIFRPPRACRPPFSCRCTRSFARPRRRSSAPVRRSSDGVRSEEHTSELQSLRHLVCRLLLEKKKKYAKSEPTAKDDEVEDAVRDLP